MLNTVFTGATEKQIKQIEEQATIEQNYMAWLRESGETNLDKCNQKYNDLKEGR